MTTPSALFPADLGTSSMDTSFTLESRKEVLRELAAAHVELLGCGCAVLGHLPTGREKIHVAMVIGAAAFATEKLIQRLHDMVTEDDFDAVGFSLPLRPSIVTRETFLKRAQTLAQTISVLLVGYRQHGSPLADAPSALALNEVATLARVIDTNLRTLLELPVDRAVLPVPGTETFGARSSSFRYVATPDVSPKSYAEVVVDSAELRRFLHFLYVDIELGVMETCAANVLDFRDMPIQFHLDMARQIWDEARHASFLLRRLEELGGYEGEHGFCHCIWRAQTCAETLADRLAIQQIIGEGNGMDVAQIVIALLQDAGDHKTAEALKFQNMDEATHCRFGNKWLLSLLKGDTVRYRELVVAAATKINRALPGTAPVAIKMRVLAGFPYEFVAFLASNPA